MTRDEYIQQKLNEPNQYSQGYVAFLDLMGFKEKCLKESCEIIKAIVDDIELLKIDYKHFAQMTIPEEIIQQAKIKIVSDSIIIVAPDDKYGLLYIICFCVFLHNRLLGCDTLLRGGITFGEYYCSENTIFGPALASAHDIESNISFYPRVVISEHIVEKLAQTHDLETEMRTFTKRSEDGFLFVHYFNFMEKISTLKYPYRQEQIEAFIQHMLDKYKTSPKVLPKYRWLNEYYKQYMYDKSKIKENNNG